MRILVSSASYIFSDYLSIGESRVSFEIVKELDRRGHEIILLSPRIDLRYSLRNTELIEVGRYDFDPDRNFLSYRLNWWRYAVKSYKVSKEILSKKEIDIVHHIRPAYKGRFSLVGILRKPFIYGPITPIWSKNHVEKVLTHGIKRKRRPLLGILTRTFALFENLAVPYLWEKTLKEASVILVQMERIKEIIPQKYLGKARVVGLGVDAEFFRPAGRPSDGKTILFLANLYIRKGLGDLLHAMPIILSKIPDARLIVVGDGPDRDFFVELTKRLGLEDKVEYRGRIHHDETVKYYQAATIYCLPSHGEPAANTLLEAMSCGLPIVATRSGGITDMVSDGKSGILVPHGDPDALSEALIGLLKDEGKRKEIGLFNRLLIEERFSIKSLVDKIEDVYKSVRP